MNANLGHNPSFTWRGIWQARIVLKQGIRWKIGDGRHVKVWYVPWLCNSENVKLETPINSELQNICVSDLMILGAKD